MRGELGGGGSTLQWRAASDREFRGTMRARGKINKLIGTKRKTSAVSSPNMSKLQIEIDRRSELNMAEAGKGAEAAHSATTRVDQVAVHGSSSIVHIAVCSVCSQALSAPLAAVTGLPRRPEEDRELVKNLGVRFGGV